MKNSILLLSVFLFSFTSPNKKTINYGIRNHSSISELPYSRGMKLKWSHFNKSYKQSRNEIAVSYTGIIYSYDSSFEGVKVNVYASFNKKQSYFLIGNNNDRVLNHEQRHFDITYLYSLRLIKRLNLVDNLSESECDSIYEQIDSELESCQKLYDNETRHSNQMDKQLYWDNLISSQIDQLESELKIK